MRNCLAEGCSQTAKYRLAVSVVRGVCSTRSEDAEPKRAHYCEGHVQAVCVETLIKMEQRKVCR